MKSFTRGAQIEAGLGVTSLEEIGLKPEGLDIQETQITIQAAEKIFRELQTDILAKIGGDKTFSKQDLLQRIRLFKGELVKLYPHTNDAEGTIVISWLVFMGTNMRESLGVDKITYVNELPQKVNQKKKRRLRRNRR